MDKKKIGLRIKHLRVKNNFSQKELAKKLDVKPSTISEIECGENPPTAHILIELKRFFCESVDWILTGDESKYYIDVPKDVEYYKDLREMIEELANNRTAKIKVLSFFYDYKAKNLSKFLPPRHLA